MGSRFMMVWGGHHECGVPVGQVCEYMCLFRASTKLDQLASGGPMG